MENLVKHQKVSKYYGHDCLQNFLLLFMFLLAVPNVKVKTGNGWEYSFWVHLIQMIQIVSLSRYLVHRLFRICQIGDVPVSNWMVIFPFSALDLFCKFCPKIHLAL